MTLEPIALFEKRTVPDATLGADEITVIARHEHLSPREAATRGANLLREPWGHAAIRQMVWDTLTDARRRGDEEQSAALVALYHRVCQRYPCPYDRRNAATRETHPFPPDRAH